MRNDRRKSWILASRLLVAMTFAFGPFGASANTCTEKLTAILSHLVETKKIGERELRGLAQSDVAMNPLAQKTGQHISSDLLPFRDLIEELLKSPHLDWKKVRSFTRAQGKSEREANLARTQTSHETRLVIRPHEAPFEIPIGSQVWAGSPSLSNDLVFVRFEGKKIHFFSFTKDNHLKPIQEVQFQHSVMNFPVQMDFNGRDLLAGLTMKNGGQSYLEIHERFADGRPSKIFFKMSVGRAPSFTLVPMDGFLIAITSQLSSVQSEKSSYILAIDKDGKKMAGRIKIRSDSNTRWIKEESQLFAVNPLQPYDLAKSASARFASLKMLNGRLNLTWVTPSTKTGAPAPNIERNSRPIGAQPRYFLGGISERAYYQSLYLFKRVRDSFVQFQRLTRELVDWRAGKTIPAANRTMLTPLLLNTKEVLKNGTSRIIFKMLEWNAEKKPRIISVPRTALDAFDIDSLFAPAAILWRGQLFVALVTQSQQVFLFEFHDQQLKPLTPVRLQGAICKLDFVLKDDLPYLVVDDGISHRLFAIHDTTHMKKGTQQP